MRFAIYLLVITALLSLVSMLVQEFLPQGIALSNLINFFGLDDPFRAFWFRLLLGILSVSLSVCVIQRGPQMIKQAFERRFITDPALLKDMTGCVRFESADGVEEVRQRFKRLRLSVRSDSGEKLTALTGVSGSLSRIGPLLNHLGMLLLILGGLTLSITGSSDTISGAAGDTLRMPEWDFALRIDDFQIIYHPLSLNQLVEIPGGRRGKVLQIEADSAEVEISSHKEHRHSHWFPLGDLKNNFMTMQSGRPMPYQGNVGSYLTGATMIVGDSMFFEHRIEVNHPLRFHGFRFYQSSFETGGVITAVDTVTLKVQSETHGEATVELVVDGDEVILPWGGFSLSAGKLFPDFRLDRNMKPHSVSGQLENPALKVMVRHSGEEIGARWVFTYPFGGMGVDDLPFNMQIVDLNVVKTTPAGYITVLDVRQDSGRWLIWMGFILATMGLLFVYTMTHRRAWAVVERQPDNRDVVHLAIKCPRGVSLRA